MNKDIHVVVVGDSGIGKTSLIAALMTGKGLQPVPSTFGPQFLPPSDHGCGLYVHDTGSLESSRNDVLSKCTAADVILLCFSCESVRGIERLHTTWMPQFRSSAIRAPVILVALRRDLRALVPSSQLPGNGSLEAAVTPLMKEFKEIETCLECSAARLENIHEVFLFAQKTVLNPLGPLWDPETGLTARCKAALLNVFRQIDRDNDGLLNDQELNAFQMRCFRAPLRPDEMESLKSLIEGRVPGTVTNDAHRFVTRVGWLTLHALSIDMGRNETAWTVLREFGYDNDLTLTDEALDVPEELLMAAALSEPQELTSIVVPRSLSSRAVPVSAASTATGEHSNGNSFTFGHGPSPSQSVHTCVVELTDAAVNFISFKFEEYDQDRDGFINDRDMELMFQTGPSARPFDDDPVWSAAKIQGLLPGRGFNKQGFLSLWALLAMRAPRTCWEHLIYLGFPMEMGALSALRLCRRHRTEHEMSSCPHAGGVIRIGVVGPRGGGKTTLLYSLLGQVTGYDLEFVVQGGRVTAMVKAMASVSLSDTGPAVPLFKTLVFEELSADDNGFIAELSSGATGMGGGSGSTSGGIRGLADAFRSLLGGGSARNKLKALGNSLSRRFDALLVAFDSQQPPSARAAIHMAGVCKDACGGNVPLTLVGCKGGQLQYPADVIQVLIEGKDLYNLPTPLHVSLEATAAHNPNQVSTLQDLVAHVLAVTSGFAPDLVKFPSRPTSHAGGAGLVQTPVGGIRTSTPGCFEFEVKRASGVDTSGRLSNPGVVPGPYLSAPNRADFFQYNGEDDEDGSEYDGESDIDSDFIESDPELEH